MEAPSMLSDFCVGRLPRCSLEATLMTLPYAAELAPFSLDFGDKYQFMPVGIECPTVPLNRFTGGNQARPMEPERSHPEATPRGSSSNEIKLREVHTRVEGFMSVDGHVCR